MHLESLVFFEALRSDNVVRGGEKPRLLCKLAAGCMGETACAFPMGFVSESEMANYGLSTILL